MLATAPTKLLVVLRLAVGKPIDPGNLHHRVTASISTLMSKSANSKLCAPHTVVAVVLQGLEAGPGPHVPGEQGLVRSVLRSDDERGE